MNENKEVMACLRQLSEQMSEQFSGIQGQLNHLDDKIDKVEKSLNGRIDSVEKNLDAKIKSLDVKIDNVEKSLNGKIDNVERSLTEKIDMVYYIACENRENIQEMRREIDELLIPYNDRNLSVNEQISKISELEAWKEEAEKVIGNHSEAIHKLQEAIA